MGESGYTRIARVKYRPFTWTRAATLLAMVGCDPERIPARRRYVPAPDVITDDASSPVGGLCTRRGAASVEIAPGTGRTRASIAWSGLHYGVAWQEATAEGTSAWFARVHGVEGPQGLVTRITHPGLHVGYPTVLWNGANWSVIYDAAWGEADGDVYQARIDARGAMVSDPFRMTRGARDDINASMAPGEQGFGMAWIAREEGGRRHVLYGMSLNRWDAPRGLAVRMLDTQLTLGAPTVTWTGAEWALTCVSARGEVKAVDFLRLSPEGLPRGVLKHISPERIGGVELENRHAVAWDGHALGVVWSELREGATQVFFRAVSARGNPLTADVRVSEGAMAASEPALVAISEGLFALAMRVEREGMSRVWVRTVRVDGSFQPTQVELQGADGRAGAPSLVYDGTGLGVVTVSPRALSFHRVALAPCVAP